MAIPPGKPPRKRPPPPTRITTTVTSPVEGLDATQDAVEIANSKTLQRWLAADVGAQVAVPLAAAVVDHTSFAKTVELQAGLGALVAIGVARVTYQEGGAYVQYVPRHTMVRLHAVGVHDHTA